MYSTVDARRLAPHNKLIIIYSENDTKYDKFTYWNKCSFRVERSGTYNNHWNFNG
jgi:hypothetical protein